MVIRVALTETLLLYNKREKYMGRDLRIDLIKLIATMMVVILHTIENTGGYMQHCMYFLGTCGIPLFLVVNGYLLYGRELTGHYVRKKIVRYLNFLVSWVVVIGTVASIVKHRFMFVNVFLGALIGKGLLFHLWFISALVVILLICYAVNILLRKDNMTVHQYVGKKMAFLIAIVLSGIFLVDIFLKKLKGITLREVLIGPLSLHVTLGYFLLGMSLHNINFPTKRACLCAAGGGYAGIYLLSRMLPLAWASSYYPSICCVVATLGIMFFGLNWQPMNDIFTQIIMYLAPASIGIWILHPLCLAVIRKMLDFFNIENTFLLRITTVPLLFIGCAFISKIALKIKVVKRLFQI